MKRFRRSDRVPARLARALRPFGGYTSGSVVAPVVSSPVGSSARDVKQWIRYSKASGGALARERGAGAFL